MKLFEKDTTKQFLDLNGFSCLIVGSLCIIKCCILFQWQYWQPLDMVCTIKQNINWRVSPLVFIQKDSQYFPFTGFTHWLGTQRDTWDTWDWQHSSQSLISRCYAGSYTFEVSKEVNVTVPVCCQVKWPPSFHSMGLVFTFILLNHSGYLFSAKQQLCMHANTMKNKIQLKTFLWKNNNLVQKSIIYIQLHFKMGLIL